MNYIEVNNLEYFDIKQIFDCGQCFRFEINGDSSVEGVALGKFLRLEQTSASSVRIYATKEDYERIWKHFLALDEDYGAVRADIKSAFPGDKTMERAMEAGRGIRILRQDSWEALCSFIISQNNNIPRIKGIISNLCRTYGDKIITEDGREFYSFPSAERVLDAGLEGMNGLRTGFRAKYIIAAAKAVCEREIDLEALSKMQTDKALAELCSLYGVGLKVASCVALFGLYKLDAFPVDVWVKRILAKYYPDGLDISKIGGYAGIAQQYLFYYERYLADKNA